MRAIVPAFLALTALTAPAPAEPRTAHPQPTPSALSAPADSAHTDAGAPDDPARTAAKAQQDAFDRRIARKSGQAMRSVCVGCDGGSVRARKPKRIEAMTGLDASGDDVVVDEPAEAPAD